LEALAEEDEDEEMKEGENPEDGSMEEISLEELIAELDGLEESEMEEGHSYSEKDGSVDPGVNDLYEKSLAEAEDDDTVGEITVDELKDIIRSVMNDVMETGEEEGEAEEAGEEEEVGEEEAGEDELNLDEILAELELEEVSSHKAGETKIQEKAEDDESKEELKEAMKTISTLRSELNEVNLLNAKLLYVNKLFKSKNLTEAQKVKVINAFDRAETVKETKNIFETLKESLNAPVKSAIKESLSFASKAAGVADRKPIVENNDFVARMQKLAGII
jgi:hypothetical protein